MSSLSPKYPGVAITILAAGASNRLGIPKQLLKDNTGDTFIRSVIKKAMFVSSGAVITVLGARYDIIREDIKDLDTTILRNTNWQEGISTSIHTVVNYIKQNKLEIEALLFLVCDQPYLDANLLNSIIETYYSSGNPIVACKYQEVIGTPILFDRSLFGSLLTLKGDRGAGAIAKLNFTKTSVIAFDLGIKDIDTNNDYKNYIEGD